MPSPNPSQGPHSTAQLVAWDREFLWHPFTPMKPWMEGKDIVIIERGEREFLIDTQGRRYIDGVSSLWCNVHGHCVPELDAAVREQLGKIAHSTLLGLTNEPAVLLAKRLVELVRSLGLGLDRVFYSDDGSTAVEVACKMAYQYWRNRGMDRPKFLSFESAYHGDTLGAVSVGGIETFHGVFRGLCFPVDLIRWDAGEGLAELLGKVESQLQGGSYAGVIIEPLIQGAGGMRMFPAGTLAGLRELCTRHQSLMIADEVMTGFGRTGKMFACEHESMTVAGGTKVPVTPDLMCLSKGLTGGYMPLGVTLATREVFEAFYVDPNVAGNLTKTFFHGHTFTGHPLACAVALASLDLFEKNQVLEHVAELMPLLSQMLERVRQMPFVADVRQCGLIGAIDLAEPAGAGVGGAGHGGGGGGWRAFPYHWRIGGELCTRMRALGLMMRPLADTLVVMPPLAISHASMERLCAGVLESVGSVEEIVEERRNRQSNEK